MTGFGGIFRKIAARVRELGRLTPIAAVTALLPMAGSAVLIAFGYPLGEWMRANGAAGGAVFAGGVLVFCGLALLPTNVVGILGGWAFGFWVGISLLMAGIVGAATVSFFMHRRIAGDKLEAIVESDERAAAIHKALTEESFWKATMVVTLLRLSVVTPFAFTNFFMAAAKVPVGAFLTGTFVGMLPRSAAVVFVGAGLSEFSLEEIENPWLLAGGIAATVAAVAFIGVLSRRALDRIAPVGETA